MESVGIRELKAHLSRRLRRVEEGHSLAVTDRGRTIATIHPVVRPEPAPGLEWAHRLVADGRASWSGGKPKGASPLARRSGSATVADAVIGDRR